MVSSIRDSFNNVLETVYEPEVILEMLEDRSQMLKLMEINASKVLNSSSVKIDFSLSPEPNHYKDTRPEVCDEHDKWEGAMNEEIHCMDRFGVYKKVPKSAADGHQILGARWVYKRKVNKLGEVVRYRARLVCQGHRQIPYDSYRPEEIYSPVVHKDTLRLFLSVCAAEDLGVYQADAKSAYLQAPLSERIYMKSPPGYATYDADGNEEIWELKNAIYGLHQGASCFWSAVHQHFIAKGYQSTLGDPCLLKKVLPNGKSILVCCYVDDFTYATPDLETADFFLAELRERFVIDEGEGKPIDFLLGMAISQNLEKGTIHMNMEMMITKLIQGVLTDEEIEKCKRVDTPMIITPLSKLENREVPKSDFDYLSVVGSLLHISNSVRCDITYAVGVLARHSLTPGHTHVKAVKRVLQYLHNTKHLGITYSRRSNQPSNIPTLFERGRHPLDDGKNILQTFMDSDYASDVSRRSTMGSVVMMNGGPISWKSVLGKTVATSTYEAEVNEAVTAVKDPIHIK